MSGLSLWRLLLRWVLLTRLLLRWVLLTRLLLRWVLLTRLLLWWVLLTRLLLRWVLLTRLLLRWILLLTWRLGRILPTRFLLRWIWLVRISRRRLLRGTSRRRRPWREVSWLLLTQRQSENACQQQHTPHDQADDRGGPQSVPDPTQIANPGHVDHHDLARVARVVVRRDGDADLRWLATGDCALARLRLALSVGIGDRDDRRVGLINRLHGPVHRAGIAGLGQLLIECGLALAGRNRADSQPTAGQQEQDPEHEPKNL